MHVGLQPIPRVLVLISAVHGWYSRQRCWLQGSASLHIAPPPPHRVQLEPRQVSRVVLKLMTLGQDFWSLSCTHWLLTSSFATKTQLFVGKTLVRTGASTSKLWLIVQASLVEKVPRPNPQAETKVPLHDLFTKLSQFLQEKEATNQLNW